MFVVFYILAGLFLLIVASGAYVFVLACVRRKELPWMVEEEIKKTSYGRYFNCIIASDAWLKSHNAQDVYITSKDGLKLHGFWIPAENPRGTILLAHGYRSTILVDFGLAFAFYHAHRSVLMKEFGKCTRFGSTGRKGNQVYCSSGCLCSI